jgi:hypothetical protein
MKLEVRSASDSETYQDVARVPRAYRTNRRGQLLDRGEICQVFCHDTGKQWFVIMHGAPATKGATIRIDDRVRERLGVHSGKTYEFEFHQADDCGKIWWALNATDIRFRLPAIIAVISGGLGLLLGLTSILISVFK